ncbi:helix-turn-helix domain-containing protein [Maribacter sp. 2304DJ31-5]|uniref:helix-turn-helix domain-containing protein n=1 Tax=Maribacter sp. 2304DJ31-5 TaxID=3386273 RepID=UPI0039BD72F4
MLILKQLRRKKNVNQTDLAEAIGVSLRTIQLYERENANIPIKNLTKIAQYFDVTIAELYSYEVNETNGDYGDKRTISSNGTEINCIDEGKFLMAVPLILESQQKNYIQNIDIANEVLSELPQISFFMNQWEDVEYTAFEITGNAMVNNNGVRDIPGNSIILGKSIPVHMIEKPSLTQKIYVIVYKDGILCKEIITADRSNKTIVCHSFNTSPEFADFEIPIADIKKLFLVVKKQVNS